MTSGTCRLVLLLLLTVAFRLHGAGRFDHAQFDHPDFFPIFPWSPLHGWDGTARDSERQGLSSISECGFNMAGFVRKEDLPECERLGLGAILFPAGDGLPQRYQREWHRLTDDEIDSRVKKIVEMSGSSPAIVGYFITDEPGVEEFPALAKAVRSVKKHAPGKWAYINLFPNYATLGAPDTSQLGTASYEDYLEQFVSTVNPQVLSYDNYMVQFSEDLKVPERAASYFLNLAQVHRAGTKHNLPFIQIVASNQLRPGRPIPSHANMLLQAYTSLAAGCRGVTWYNYYGRRYAYAPIDDAGDKTETWYYLQAVNREIAAQQRVLTRLRSTGFYFTAPAPKKSLPLLPGNVVKSIESTTSMMVGEFEGTGGEQFALVVNLSLGTSARFTVTPLKAGSLSKFSTATCRFQPFKSDDSGAWLPPGGGALLKMKP